jgi:hypothetical protein
VDDDGQVHVHPRRLQDVLEANGGAAVADVDDDLLLRRKSHGDARRQRDGPSVEAVDGVGGEVAVHDAVTADVGHQDHVQRGRAQRLQCLHGVADDEVMSAAFTVWKFGFDQETVHRIPIRNIFFIAAALPPQ